MYFNTPAVGMWDIYEAMLFVQVYVATIYGSHPHRYFIVSSQLRTRT